MSGDSLQKICLRSQIDLTRSLAHWIYRMDGLNLAGTRLADWRDFDARAASGLSLGCITLGSTARFRSILDKARGA